MQLDAVPASGDPRAMLDCLVEEFARLGLTAAQIENLFERPHYQATYGLRQAFEPETLRRRIRSIVQRSGVLNFKVTEVTRASCPPDHDCPPGTSDPRRRN